MACEGHWRLSSRTDFNGAMAVRPWMESKGKGKSKKRKNFNGAMAVRPWMEKHGTKYVA